MSELLSPTQEIHRLRRSSRHCSIIEAPLKVDTTGRTITGQPKTLNGQWENSHLSPGSSQKSTPAVPKKIYMSLKTLDLNAKGGRSPLKKGRSPVRKGKKLATMAEAVEMLMAEQKNSPNEEVVPEQKPRKAIKDLESLSFIKGLVHYWKEDVQDLDPNDLIQVSRRRITFSHINL